MASPKKNFLLGGGPSGEIDDLIRVEKSSYKPTPTGTRGHMSLHRTKIARGGLGSGKTRWGGEHIDNLCLRYPGALCFIGRKDITSLKTTTQLEYLEKVVSPETIEGFNVNDNILYYKNGSKVLFRETKEPDKVKSLELTAYMVDEADESPTDEIWEKLDDRLRQTFLINGKRVVPPHAGLIILNPVDEHHWIYKLAHRKDIDLIDLQFNTYENEANLPPQYIPNLLRKLPPWEIRRLIYGEWGRSVKGKPVIHGFKEKTHVRHFDFNPNLPLLRGWDFGFNRPALRISQLDPVLGRYSILDEYLGDRIYLDKVVPIANKMVLKYAGAEHPVMDYGDPHGADEKDTGESSIDYLRVHHKIYVRFQRSRIRTGLEEIQHKVLTKGPRSSEELDIEDPLFEVHPRCKITIAGYLYGYARGDDGIPIKDGYFDHLPDIDRYIMINTVNAHLAAKRKQKRRRPRNRYTGY